VGVRDIVVRRLAVALFCLCLPTLAQAAPHKNVLPAEARTVPGARAVEVLVPQAELGTNINPSMIGLVMGGGLVGVLIDVKVDSDRAAAAQDSIIPIRVALMDFDADQLAIDATQSAIAGVPWFQAQQPSFGRDTSVLRKSGLLTAATTNQVVFFEYTYDTAPDFSSIRVGVTISIAAKPGADGNSESQLAARNLVYAQTITGVVKLQNPTGAQDNAVRWAANDGALARRALTTAFGDVGALIPRAFAFTDGDVKSMAAGESKQLDNNVSGEVVEDGPASLLLFNGGLIHVQTLHE
jgi:hypothetical protein